MPANAKTTRFHVALTDDERKTVLAAIQHQHHLEFHPIDHSSMLTLHRKGQYLAQICHQSLHPTKPT